MCSTHALPVNVFNLEGEEIMLALDNENFLTLGENWTHDPPNTTCLSDAPTTEPEGRELDSCLGHGGCDPFNQNSNRSDREKRTTSKGGPVFPKLFRLDRTDPLSFGPKFPESLVEWIVPGISFAPGEHGFSSFQVENVYWKCMCAAHWCIIKINKNKNKINLRNHEFVRKKKQKNKMTGER